MKYKYYLFKYEKDNIPGFRDSWRRCIDGSNNSKDFDKYKDSSTYHSGWGAGSGSIDTYYYTVKANEASTNQIKDIKIFEESLMKK